MNDEQKAALERLRRWLNEDDCKYAGDLETALAYIDELERAKEELVRTGSGYLEKRDTLANASLSRGEAFIIRGQMMTGLDALRAALQRHKEP